MKSTQWVHRVITASLTAILFLITPAAHADKAESLRLATSACNYIKSILSTLPEDQGLGYDYYTLSYDNPENRSKYLLAGADFLKLSKEDPTNKTEFERYAKILTTENTTGNKGYQWARYKATLDSSSLFEPIEFCVSGSADALSGSSMRDDEYVEHNLSNYMPGQAAPKVEIEDDISEEESSALPPALFIAICVVAALLIQASYIAKVARNAGRSYKAWFVLGFFLPLVSALIVWSFKPEKK